MFQSQPAGMSFRTIHDRVYQRIHVSVPTGWDVLSDTTLFKLLRQKGLNRQNSEPPPVLIKIVHF